MALKTNGQSLKTISNKLRTNSPPHACVILTLKTAALLLSSWEIPLTGFSQQLSLLSLPKHLLDSLVLDR